MTDEDVSLWAVSAVDGRYQELLKDFGLRFSEGALILTRIRVELLWLRHLVLLAQSGTLNIGWRPSAQDLLLIDSALEDDFRSAPGMVKKIEDNIKHDVKAVEYFLRQYLKNKGLGESSLAMIHVPCTSEDINNLAYALMFQEIQRVDILPSCQSVLLCLAEGAEKNAGMAMLSRTHGQSASATTLGKELAVFGHRLERKIQEIQAVIFDGKINGAVGNFNAHYLICPDADWQMIARSFVETLGLRWNPLTTQIESHDGLVRWCHLLAEYQAISLDLVRDLWAYISLGYFRQAVRDQEVGSSTMPHKVNPIHFENAEGNFGISSAMATHFAGKLPVSRWQRDLSDSTVLRAFGEMLGHFLIAQKSLLKGLSRIDPDQERILQDLTSCDHLLAEPFQMALRTIGICDAYEELKALSRGRKVCAEDFHALLVRYPDLSPDLSERLKKLTAQSYTGIAKELAIQFAHETFSRYRA
ncbi:MAG: adenylosuccinate lyase [Deltaproteobacteria bacterium]|nr:adenylosuccinate lyase [Deltaproteobacteria bacterium]